MMRVDKMMSLGSDISEPATTELFEFEPDQASDMRLNQEKQRYRDRIINMCKSRQRPLNVAVIGPPGVGKSSLINTIAASFSNETWREHAYSGFHGDASQITVFTTSFPKCCHGNDEDYQNVNLPTLIDIAGFTDEDEDRYVELLRIVFYGHLPEGESLSEADEYAKNYGLDGLRQKYSQNNEKLKVDRVVIVSSATEVVPTKLIKCVVEAARPSGVMDSRKRTIPLFGVLTKQDKVGSVQISQADYDETEKQFINAVGLVGSRHRFLRCRNYCDDVDHGRRIETVIPELDLPALKFMSQLADPVIEVLNEGESYTQTQPEDICPEPVLKEPETNVRQRQTSSTRSDSPPRHIPQRVSSRSSDRQSGGFLNDLNITRGHAFVITIVIEAFVLGIALQVLLAPPVDIAKLRGVCKYVNQHGSSNFAQRELIDICDGMTGYSGKGCVTVMTLICYILIRVGSKFVSEKVEKLKHQ